MKLIDKDVLVAEIERRRDAALTRQKNLESIGQKTVLNEMIANELNRIISFIDILEVKEVDLDEEIKSYFKGFGKFPSVGIDDCIDIAKHFFELGLKVAQKGEEV